MRVGALLIVAGLVVGACGSDSDEESDSSSAADTTASPEAEVSASATFTGDSCDYDGPDELAVGAEVSITVVNATPEPDVGFGLVKVRDGTTAKELAEASVEAVAEDNDGGGFVFAPTSEGTEYELVGVVDVPGTWVVNCFFFAEGGDVEYPVVLRVSDS